MQGDNNVKLIVLDRLNDIFLHKHRTALEEFVVDILRALSSPSMEVKKRVIHIALKLITKRTVKVYIFIEKLVDCVIGFS